jgi:inner membrane protein
MDNLTHSLIGAVQTAEQYGSYDSTPFLALKGNMAPRSIGMDDPSIAQRAVKVPEARAFLFWSRMPVAQYDGKAIILRDQRFMDSVTGGQFQVLLGP